MSKQNMLILLQRGDYLSRKFVGTREKHEASSIDIKKVIAYLEEDFNVHCVQYKNFDYTKRYKGYYVIYSSSETRGGGVSEIHRRHFTETGT